MTSYYTLFYLFVFGFTLVPLNETDRRSVDGDVWTPMSKDQLLLRFNVD